MGVCIVRAGMAMWLAGCFCQCVCQTDPSAPAPRQEPSDYSLYSAFFQRVAIQSKPTLLNGQPADPPKPSIQEATGLTDREMKALNGIAADCQASIDSIYRQRPGFVFEALLESIESGKDTSGDVQQLAKDRENQRERIVLDHVQQLRTAFGAARFQALDSRLRAEIASRPRKAAPRQ